MTDEPVAPEPTSDEAKEAVPEQEPLEQAPTDLSSLAFDFTPSWAKNTPGTVSDAREGRGERGRGGSRGGGDRRGGGRRGAPRGGSGGGDRRSSGGGDRRGGSRSDGGRGAPRGGRDARPARPPRLPLRIDFIPDNQRLKKVIRVMKEAKRAFSLNELADKFISNPSFFSVKIAVHHPKGTKAEPVSLYQMVHTRWVFFDRASCEQHALEYALDTQFTREEVAIDPPAGQFVGVGRCRLGGELVGPPNWHGYVLAIEKLRQEKYDHMGADDFRRKIELVRDEEVIEAWKASMSVDLRYVPKKAAPEKPKEKPAKEKKEAVEEKVVEAASDVPEVVTPEEVPVTEEVSAPEEKASEEAPVEEVLIEDAVAEEPSKEEAPAEDPEPEESLTRAEAEKRFKGDWLKAAVKEGSRFIMPGSALSYLPTSPLQELVSHVHKRESASHMTLMRALKPAFKHMRLIVFQDEGASYVTAISPAALDREHVIPQMNEVSDHVEAHPGCSGKEVLLALCPDCDLSAEPAKHYVAALHMLIDQGQLIEFQDKRLKLPVIKTAPKPKKEGAVKEDAATTPKEGSASEPAAISEADVVVDASSPEPEASSASVEEVAPEADVVVEVSSPEPEVEGSATPDVDAEK